MPMATTDALMGVGVPAQLAILLGGNPAKIAGAANASQTGAAVLLSRNVELNPGASTNSFVPQPSAGIMEPYFIVNPTANTANVFVPVGHTLSTVTTGGLNGHVSLVQNTACIMWQYKPKFWACNLSAVV